MPPLISVIITTKNEERNIANCIESVLRQSYDCDKIEIIVVDNNSTDKTKEIVLSYSSPDKGRLGGVKISSAKNSPLERGEGCVDSKISSDFKNFMDIRLFSRGPERSAQRNYGVKKSNGGYFLYLDADMILHKDIIKECTDKFIKSKSQKVHKVKTFDLKDFTDIEDSSPDFQPDKLSRHSDPTLETLQTFDFITRDLAGLYIPEIIMGKSFWCKVRRFERSFYDGTVIDAVRFIKKDVFQKAGGFDENLIAAEDWDLDKRLRKFGKFDIIKNPLYHNESDFKVKNYLDKKSFYSGDIKKYISKWSQSSDGIKATTDPEIKKQLGFYYRFIGVFIENGKWKKLIKHPILSFGVYSLRVLVGLIYLKNKLISKNKYGAKI